MSTNRYVVVFDFPGIKEYVFGTDRLVEIRGASSILDQLNRIELPSFIKGAFPSPQTSQHCVFAAGGGAQFILQAPFSYIQDCMGKLQGRIYEASGGKLRLLAGIASLQDDYPAALNQAFFELDCQKRRFDSLTELPIHCGFIRECDSCSGSASLISRDAGETRLLCESCHRKTQKGRSKGHWSDFVKYLAGAGDCELDNISDLRPEDFEQIGARCQAKKGYTALVYGDGNAMGKLVKAIRTDQQFKFFSKTVSDSLQKACYEAMKTHCRPVDGKIPADILLLGGDDIIVYMAADIAMPFGIDLARRFEENTKKRFQTDSFFQNLLKGKGLTISLGISYGRTHTPIAILVNQAEELLKSAKKKGSSLADSEFYSPSCIDFHLASRYNQIHVNDTRQNHLCLHTPGGKILHLFAGPYTLEEAENLLCQATVIKRSGLARSRLHRLGDAPFLGYSLGNLETLITWGRTAKAEQRETLFHVWERLGCTDFPPWRLQGNTIDTPIVDLVSLSNWISSSPKEKETTHAPSPAS